MDELAFYPDSGDGFMTWHTHRTHMTDLQRAMESLRDDVMRLTRSMGNGHVSDAASMARHYARSAADRLGELPSQTGKVAGALVPTGVPAALAAPGPLARRLDGAARNARDAMARHPAATAIAVVGVGLTLAFVLSLAVREPRRRKVASPGGNVRRPPAKASRKIGRTARHSRQD